MKSYEDLQHRLAGFGPTIEGITRNIRKAKDTGNTSFLEASDSQLERLSAELTQISNAMVEIGNDKAPAPDADGAPVEVDDDDKARGSFFVADNGTHYLLVGNKAEGSLSDDFLIDKGVEVFRRSEANFPAEGADAIPDDVLRSRIVVEDYVPGTETKIDAHPGPAKVVPATGEPPAIPRNADAAEQPVA